MSDQHDWIMTSTGRVFYPLAPRPEDIDIKDIAHALGAVNRFNGHTREPYSVAQHSVLVSLQFDQDDPNVALLALLHDAAEAYLGDIPRPLKRTPVFAGYREAEHRLEAVINRVFNVDAYADDASVMQRIKDVDRRMLRTEQAHLMPPAAPGELRNDVPVFPDLMIVAWPARSAELAFLVRYYALCRRRTDIAGGRTA